MKLKKRRKILNNRNKSVTKSIILKKLADSYPGFLKKDLEKILSITLDEMRNALKRDSRIELRNIFTLIPKIQKEGFGEIQKQVKKYLLIKKNIGFKLSKDWLKK